MNRHEIILLMSAKTYIMMARILYKRGIDGSHYVKQARNCIALYYSLNSSNQLRLVA